MIYIFHHSSLSSFFSFIIILLYHPLLYYGNSCFKYGKIPVYYINYIIKMIKKVSSAVLGIGKGLVQTSTAAYHENVIDHYENPRNVGSLDKSKKNVGTGLVGAPACGDVMKLQIELNEDGETI